MARGEEGREWGKREEEVNNSGTRRRDADRCQVRVRGADIA
jgi:hypothetical protein